MKKRMQIHVSKKLGFDELEALIACFYARSAARLRSVWQTSSTVVMPAPLLCVREGSKHPAAMKHTTTLTVLLHTCIHTSAATLHQHRNH